MSESNGNRKSLFWLKGLPSLGGDLVNDMSLDPSIPFYVTLRTEHEAWLAGFDPQHTRNFQKVCAGDFEAGMAEAAMRRELQQLGHHVEPAEVLSGNVKSVDFLCTSSAGDKFFVEVTCLSIENVTKATGLPDPPESGVRNYGSMIGSLWKSIKRKAVQCGGLPYPTLVAVCTHHATASMVCVQKPHIEMLATGETYLSWSVNSKTGVSGDTSVATNLDSAAFINRDRSTDIAFVRSSISGLLVVGLGAVDPRVLGVFHPNPARVFDRELLPDIAFCEVQIDKQNGTLKTRWNGGEPE